MQEDLDNIATEVETAGKELDKAFYINLTDKNMNL